MRDSQHVQRPRGAYALGAGLLALLLTGASAGSEPPSAPAPAPQAVPMLLARQRHTATLLEDGGVLVAGGAAVSGDSDTVRAEAELFDEVSGTWTETGSMTVPRDRHTAARLADGRVLVVGGGDDIVSGANSAELYDPKARSWSLTGPMTTARYTGHTETLLGDGRALVAGGFVDRAEIFDPTSGRWSPAADMPADRSYHSATLLKDGRVLVAGGIFPGTAASPDPALAAAAWVWSPSSGSWSPAGTLEEPRQRHAAVLLRSGRVLLAGGESAGDVPSMSAEVWDPASETWSRAGELKAPHAAPSAALLPDGRVLLTGGGADGTVAELFDEDSGSWTVVDASPDRGHPGGTATLLPDLRVLSAGGVDGSSVTADAELFSPVPPLALQARVLPAAAAAAALSADPTFGFRDLYAFPNPARRGERMTIRLQAGLADGVDVDIYDIAGHRVHSAGFGPPSVLDDGNGKGPQYTYDYPWEASGMGSGVYIYAVKARKEGQREIRRLGKGALIK